MRRPLALAFALAVVAGCAPTPDAPAPAPAVGVEEPVPAAAIPADSAGAADPSAPASLAVDGDGLRVVSATGAARPLAFGQPAADVLSAVTALRGPPADRGEAAECGPGPLGYAVWPGGLTVYTQGGQFAGWALADRPDPGAAPVTTVTGLGIGTAWSDADASDAEVQETTLGTEFLAGGVSGLLDRPGGVVTALWAGASCVFR